MSNLKDNTIIQNIQISEELKRDLYMNCVGEKKRSKISFIPTKQILVASVALMVVASGITTSAAIIHWRDRLKAMPEEVIEEYVEVVNTRQEGSSYERSLTEEEHNRMMKLLDEYHEGRFPENDLPIYDTEAELPQGTMGYVKDKGVILMPETTLTDEQLLELLDYEEKTTYSAFGMPSGEGTEIHFDDTLTEEDAETVNKIAVDAVKKYFGYDATEAWECVIDSYEGHVEGEYEHELLVNIMSNELGSDVAFVIIDRDTGVVSTVGLGGWGTYYQLTPVSEIEAKMDSYVGAAEEFLHKNFEGCGESKTIQYRLMNGEDDEEAETLMLLFEMEQGYYMVEISAYNSSICSFTKFKSRAGYDAQLEAVPYKVVKQ